MSEDVSQRVRLPVYDDGTDRPVEPHDSVVERPRTREDCVGGLRPCPWISCKHHLVWFAVSRRTVDDAEDRSGVARARRERLLEEAVDQLGEAASCELDLIDAHPTGLTLEETGQVLGLTRERIRQIEAKALERLPKVARREGLTEEDAANSGRCEADDLPTPAHSKHTRARPVEEHVRTQKPAPEGVPLLTELRRAEDTGWCPWYGCKLRATGCVGRQNARDGNAARDPFCAEECTDGPLVAAAIGAEVLARREQRSAWGEGATSEERFRARLAAGLCVVPGCDQLRGAEDRGGQSDPLVLALCKDHRRTLYGAAAGSTERRERLEAFGVDLDALDAWLDLRASAPRCQVPHCRRPAEPGHDCCETHLKRAMASRRAPQPAPVTVHSAPTDEAPTCSREGCTRPAKEQGLCGRHAGTVKRAEMDAARAPQPAAPCAVPGCERPKMLANGIEPPLDTYCALHRNRARNQLYKLRLRERRELPQSAPVPEVATPPEPASAPPSPSADPSTPQESAVHESSSRPAPSSSSPDSAEDDPRQLCAAKGCRQPAGAVRADTHADLAPLCPGHRKIASDRARSRGVDRATVVAELTGKAPPPQPTVPAPAPVPTPKPTPVPAPPQPAPAATISRKVALTFTLPPGGDADRALACAERVGSVAALERLLERIEAAGGVENAEAVLARVEALGGRAFLDGLAVALKAVRGS